ncbi:hypothetical protein Taro_003212 [Colocasia esculenta]|uniref:Transmembrane protein n=1 Tax=Colocasia esculenta TaxID=4460 RepID=A0A843TIM6_COLES|nr:hypothetical protein [Colocasia esculenta]
MDCHSVSLWHLLLWPAEGGEVEVPSPSAARGDSTDAIPSFLGHSQTSQPRSQRGQLEIHSLPSRDASDVRHFQRTPQCPRLSEEPRETDRLHVGSMLAGFLSRLLRAHFCCCDATSGPEVCYWFGWCVLEGFPRTVPWWFWWRFSQDQLALFLLAAVFSLMIRVVWSFGSCILVKVLPKIALLSLLVKVLPRSALCLFRATVVLPLWFEVCCFVGLRSGEVLPGRLLALLVEVLSKAASCCFGRCCSLSP